MAPRKIDGPVLFCAGLRCCLVDSGSARLRAVGEPQLLPIVLGPLVFLGTIPRKFRHKVRRFRVGVASSRASASGPKAPRPMKHGPGGALCDAQCPLFLLRKGAKVPRPRGMDRFEELKAPAHDKPGHFLVDHVALATSGGSGAYDRVQKWGFPKWQRYQGSQKDRRFAISGYRSCFFFFLRSHPFTARLRPKACLQTSKVGPSSET